MMTRKSSNPELQLPNGGRSEEVLPPFKKSSTTATKRTSMDSLTSYKWDEFSAVIEGAA